METSCVPRKVTKETLVLPGLLPGGRVEVGAFWAILEPLPLLPHFLPCPCLSSLSQLCPPSVEQQRPL